MMNKEVLQEDKSDPNNDGTATRGWLNKWIHKGYRVFGQPPAVNMPQAQDSQEEVIEGQSAGISDKSE